MNFQYSRKNLYNMCRQAFIAFTVFFSLVFSLNIPVTHSVEASEFYEFERMWPTLPQPWYFNQPNDMAIDLNGFVYVADTWNHRIQKFDSDGNFITKFGTLGSAPGQFNEPEGIAVGPDGSLYIADTGNNRIQVFKKVDLSLLFVPH